MEQKRAAIIGGSIAVAGLAAVLIASAVFAPTYEAVTACPAIGYATHVDVHVSGDAAAVQRMRLCDDAKCVTTQVVTDDGEGGIGRGRQVSLHEWTMQTPDGANVPRMALTAFDSDGSQLATHSYDLEWRRVAPGDQCNLSQKTDPVTLAVP